MMNVIRPSISSLIGLFFCNAFMCKDIFASDLDFLNAEKLKFLARYLRSLSCSLSLSIYLMREIVHARTHTQH